MRNGEKEGSMGKHTPGPLHISSRPDSPRIRPKIIRKYFSISPENGPAIAILEAGREDIQEANAFLFAAAPDMLEALEERVEVACRRTCDKDAGLHTGECDRARAAIAKAKGEA